MVFLYALTIFTSAALLFSVQPMFARMVLPLLGGSPAVWNTAMVFYQSMLLAGYAYAHFGLRWLGLKRHAWWHVLVLLLPFFFLPIAVPLGSSPPVHENPSWWLLCLMATGIGLPFFAVSTTSPIVQKWFATTKHPWAADPYFLYVASNVGSMLALISYPLLIEPRIFLEQQSHFWTWGYVALVGLIVGCVACLPKSPAIAVFMTARPDSPMQVERLEPWRRLRWVFLSFVPSSLMLSVTTYLSSDIAVIPLMWILPLSLYLLTFILGFMRRQVLSRTLLAHLWPIALVPLIIALKIQAALPIGVLLTLHLAAFFIGALFCHTELAADRPGTAHLTEFYLWMSLGGVLGGIFNALIAPLVFQSVIEYPLILVFVCLAGLRRDPSGRSPRRFVTGDWVWPALLGLMMFGMTEALKAGGKIYENNTLGYLVFGIPALFCYFFSRRPFRFALGVAVILSVGSFYPGGKDRILHVERSFFGVHRVEVDPTGRYHVLIHGVTIHGKQSVEVARRTEPLAYYYPTGPIGQVLREYQKEPQARIGVVGLGAGALVAYAVAGQKWTFYEIDPVVVKLATNTAFFSYLSDAPVKADVVLGDARLSLAADRDKKYDLLILDAYSSDGIPMHLVSREALSLYLNHLSPDGILAFHISNVHLDLEPVFANLAHDARLACLTRDDTKLTSEESVLGKSPSTWLVMARRTADLDKLAGDVRWTSSRRGEGDRVWTDHYSSLSSIFRWN
jgi:hypothetical protein